MTFASDKRQKTSQFLRRGAYTRAQVVFAARSEMARTVDDVLARRTRAMFLNLDAARAAASEVAQILAVELGRDAVWQTDQLAAFESIGRRDAAMLGPRPREDC
jgi:glycerol-3-phosphate dehydrogenase